MSLCERVVGVCWLVFAVAGTRRASPHRNVPPRRNMHPEQPKHIPIMTEYLSANDQHAIVRAANAAHRGSHIEAEQWREVAGYSMEEAA